MWYVEVPERGRDLIHQFRAVDQDRDALATCECTLRHVREAHRFPEPARRDGERAPYTAHRAANLRD